MQPVSGFCLSTSSSDCDALSNRKTVPQEMERSLQSWLDDPNSMGNKDEAVARIKEVFETDGNNLDLRDLGLNSLPGVFSHFIDLRSLDLSFNSFTSLSEEIGKLVDLRSLNLSFNSFTSLPKEIKNLIQLQVFDVSFNQLRSLPEEIKVFSLFEFHVHSNPLISIPEGFEHKLPLSKKYVFCDDDRECLLVAKRHFRKNRAQFSTDKVNQIPLKELRREKD